MDQIEKNFSSSAMTGDARRSLQGMSMTTTDHFKKTPPGMYMYRSILYSPNQTLEHHHV